MSAGARGGGVAQLVYKLRCARAAALLVALVLIWLVRGRAMIAELEEVIMPPPPPPPPIVWWAERMKSRMNDYLLRVEL